LYSARKAIMQHYQARVCAMSRWKIFISATACPS
jgi:hypothetical protein